MRTPRDVLIATTIMVLLLAAAQPSHADGASSCGNGICDGEEHCNNCPRDCGCPADKLCGDENACVCPDGTYETEEGGCVSECNETNCEVWDSSTQECVSACDPAQQYCDTGIQRCVDFCDRSRCEWLDAEGSCEDICEPEGRDCNGFGGCICPPGQVEIGDECKAKCIHRLCEERRDDGECHNYCEETGAECEKNGIWDTDFSDCVCKKCDRPGDDGLCADICEPLGAVCTEVHPDDWSCRCPEGTEPVNIDDVVYCLPKCALERCEARDSDHACRDTCPPQGLVCVDGSCASSADSSSSSSGSSTGTSAPESTGHSTGSTGGGGSSSGGGSASSGYCGDGSCGLGEDCWGCAWDCCSSP